MSWALVEWLGAGLDVNRSIPTYGLCDLGKSPNLSEPVFLGCNMGIIKFLMPQVAVRMIKKLLSMC